MSDRCEDKIENALESRLEDLRLLWLGYTGGECPKCDGNCVIEDKHTGNNIDCPFCDGNGTLDEDIKDLGSLNEYGLSFDYVAPYTFTGQSEGYFRYQLSWGGPSEEFRFEARKERHGWIVDEIEFWYLDWFDGAKRQLYGDDWLFMKELLEGFFMECSGDAVYNDAMQDYDPSEYLTDCESCGEEYEINSSSANEDSRFCSETCENEYQEDSEDNESED